MVIEFVNVLAYVNLLQIQVINILCNCFESENSLGIPVIGAEKPISVGTPNAEERWWFANKGRNLLTKLPMHGIFCVCAEKQIDQLLFS